MASAMRAANIMRTLVINVSRTTCIRGINTVPNSQASSSNLLYSHHTPNNTSGHGRFESTMAAPNLAQNSTGDSPPPRPRVGASLKNLERFFDQFQERCQKYEKVGEKDFVKIFDQMTKAVQKLEEEDKLGQQEYVTLSLICSALLRCCGKLMTESTEKIRELLAGNLWQFMAEKNIPKDITHYNSLLRVLNENGTNFDPKKLMDEIQKANLSPDRITYQRLIHQYCMQGDVAGATDLLEKMKELNLELTENIFSSLILGYSKQDNPPTVSEMFDLMRSNGVDPGPRSITSALLAVVDLLPKNQKANDDLKMLVDLMHDQDVQMDANEIIDLQVKLTPLRDNEHVKRALLYLTEPIRRNYGVRNKIVSGLIKSKQYDQASEMFWSSRPSDNTIASGGVGMSYISNLISSPDTPADLPAKECDKLKEMGYNPKPYHRLYYSAAECGRLDIVRIALKRMSEEEPLKCQYFWPLLAQAKSQDEILSVLKNDLNPKMDSNDLAETFSQWVWPRFEGSIQKVFDANKELGYSQNMLISSFFDYCVNENKIDEAIKIVADSSPEQQEVEGEGSEEATDHDSSVIPRRGSAQTALLGRLLMRVAEHTRDADMVMKVFEVCKRPDQMTSRNLSPLVKVHILNGDYDKAIEAFLKLVEEYRIITEERTLITHCLNKKDPDSLQKIMNALSNAIGEGNSLFELAVCCLESGKLKQAQKIFSSPGLRVRPQKVYYSLNRLAKAGDLAIIENYVSLVRNLYDVDREYLYQTLLSTYDRASSGDRALNLWNTMQEEDFQPSKRIMVQMAEVLERNNIAVPFQKPRIQAQDQRRSVKSLFP